VLERLSITYNFQRAATASTQKAIRDAYSE